jgi:TRAP-type C4-dicarboxylate transport system substrate-binding protein
MKKRMPIWMCFVSAIVFISWVGMVSIAQAKTLKYSSPYGETNPMTSSMQWFGKELEKRTNGEYKAKFFFSGTMGKAPDMPEMCKNRAVDFIFTGMGYTPHIFKLNRGFELMYITENPHANGAALWDLYHNYKPIRDEWEKNGLMMVFPAGIDIMACQGRKATRNVDDLKGQKLRSYAGVAEMIKLWDGNPIALSYAEIYDALNRGVLDGAFGIRYFFLYCSVFLYVELQLY